MIVFCVFNNPRNCCLVLTIACCAASHLSVQMCALWEREESVAHLLAYAADGFPAGDKFWQVQRPVEGLSTTEALRA